MSMPSITPGSGTRCQAVTDVVESIALEQTALSHILNAEGEKIQYVVAHNPSQEQLLEINKTVAAMLNAVTRLEMVLQSKLELFQDCLCRDCSTG